MAVLVRALSCTESALCKQQAGAALGAWENEVCVLPSGMGLHAGRAGSAQLLTCLGLGSEPLTMMVASTVGSRMPFTCKADVKTLQHGRKVSPSRHQWSVCSGVREVSA